MIITLSLGAIVGGKKMAIEKKCFIIMPITTPGFMVEKYRDGKDHFKHVLECLFMPGVQKAGYQVVPPTAKGADLIHAGIVHNLETADIVLCDMSGLNPNVFFEFGIRTSLNKPVCVVRDELTDKVPFDTAILNYHEYKSSLETWEIEAEIKLLSEHIAASAERSKNENTLWKYFGLKKVAVPSEGEVSIEAKIDYLAMKVDSLSKQIGSKDTAGRPEDGVVPGPLKVLRKMVECMVPIAVRVTDAGETESGYVVLYRGPSLSTDKKAKISQAIRNMCGIDINLLRESD